MHFINAGKFRRYTGQNWLKRLVDAKTILLNVRDLQRTFRGLYASRRLLKKVKPDIVFIKGGYVSVPVGLACAMAKVSYITHDSDVVPGLANRLIARWALKHATGFEASLYPYPKNKIVFTGIPLNQNYQKIDSNIQQAYRRKINLPNDSLVLLVTGGSLGAKRLNQAFEKLATNLLLKFPKLIIVHQTGSQGENIYSEMDQKYKNRIIKHDFLNDLYLYSGAADLILTRAGATTTAELAVQAKAIVVVPNPELTGGHQSENAKYLLSENAAKVITETELRSNPAKLEQTLSNLLESNEQRAHLAANLAKLAHPRAASLLAQLIISSTPERQ